MIVLFVFLLNLEIFLVKILVSYLDSIIGNFEKKFFGFNINEEMVVFLFGFSFLEFKFKIFI